MIIMQCGLGLKNPQISARDTPLLMSHTLIHPSRVSEIVLSDGKVKRWRELLPTVLTAWLYMQWLSSNKVSVLSIESL